MNGNLAKKFSHLCWSSLRPGAEWSPAKLTKFSLRVSSNWFSDVHTVLQAARLGIGFGGFLGNRLEKKFLKTSLKMQVHFEMLATCIKTTMKYVFMGIWNLRMKIKQILPFRKKLQLRDRYAYHGCMARGGHGLPKVSPGPVMPFPSMPCGWATPETASWPSSTSLDTPRRLPVTQTIYQSKSISGINEYGDGKVKLLHLNVHGGFKAD
jgi:hypothetical protein